MLTLEEQYAIARGVQRGDPVAAEQLLTAFRPLMVATVAKLAYIHRGTADYEDLGAMVETWTFELTRNKYRPDKGSLAGFLQAQLRFKLLDELERLRPPTDEEGPVCEGSLDELAETGREPVGEDGRESFLPDDDEGRDRIAREIVERTRAGLGDEYLLAIFEMKLAGMGVRPIAKALGVSHSKVDRDWRNQVVEPVMRPIFQELAADVSWIGVWSDVD